MFNLISKVRALIDHRNELSFTLIKPWRIPCVDVSHNNYTKKANRYLAYQQKRLISLACADKGMAFHLFCILISNSRSLQVYYFNKVCRGGYYRFTRAQVLTIIAQMRRKIRYADTNLLLKRVYIPKINGRLRPLGVPLIYERIVNAAFTDLLYVLLYKDLSENQFGFIPGRDLVGAGKAIGIKSQHYRYMYEFDLDSFFNRVSREQLVLALTELGLPQELIMYIYYTNRAIPESKKFEKEVEVYTDGHILIKRGVPQGLPGSPLLAIIVLNKCLKDFELDSVTYADDGIIFSDDPNLMEKLESYKYHMKNHYGIVFSDKIKENGLPATRRSGNVISFLGLSGNRLEDTIYVPDGDRGIERSGVSDKMIRDIIRGFYNKEKVVRQGDVVKDSFLDNKGWEVSEQFKYGCRYVQEYLEGKPHTICGSGFKFYDIGKSSSICCNQLLMVMRNLPALGNNFRKKFYSGKFQTISPNYGEVLLEFDAEKGWNKRMDLEETKHFMSYMTAAGSNRPYFIPELFGRDMVIAKNTIIRRGISELNTHQL